MFLSAFMNIVFSILVPALSQQTIATSSPFSRRHPLPPNYRDDLIPEVHPAYDQCLQNEVSALSLESFLNAATSAFQMLAPWILAYCMVKWLFWFIIQTIATPSQFPRRLSLPPNPYQEDLNPEVHSAYNQCLQNEVEAGDNATLLVYARCLGFLIIEAPNDAARDYISHEIMECKCDYNRMNALAQLYINHLFRLFCKDKRRIPRPSLHPSRPSFEDERFFFSATVDPAPNDHSASKRAALERDNFCCMVTGDVETDYHLNMLDDNKIARYCNMTMTRTNFCHIFSPFSSQGLEPDVEDDHKTNYAGSVRSIILNYGRIDMLDELNGSDCHRLSNGLTLTTLIHDEFDRLCLWFEAIPNAPHTYRVCTLLPQCVAVRSLPHPRTVVFATTTNHPLPDPRYLKLHAIVCRVGHLSGVTEYLDTYDQ